MTKENDRIRQLFGRLDSWRHLPAYQLERRADLFFSLYLPLVVELELGLEFDPVVIPEFPIRKAENVLAKLHRVLSIALSERWLIKARPQRALWRMTRRSEPFKV